MYFGALPPEINSGLMYMGVGSGPMLSAAIAWERFAAELHTIEASYRSMIESLAIGPWTGPSSSMMETAAALFAAWISATAERAEEAATQVKIAAAEFETTFAKIVPPSAIATNRSLLMTLIATNAFGQNTPAIETAQAQYAEMWAQDAEAMYVYAASSAKATQLAPFTEPPQITNPAGTASQSAAVAQAVGGSVASDVQTQLSQLINSVPHALQALATTNAPLMLGTQWPFQLPSWLIADLQNWNTIWSVLTGPYSLPGWSSIPGGPFLSFGQVYSYAQNGQGLQAFFTPAKPITGALAPIAKSLTPYLSSSSPDAGPASGAMGRAALIGSLSVPQSWTQAAPAFKTLASVLSANVTAASAAPLTGEDGVFSEMALSSLVGRALGATAFGSGGGAAAHTLGGVAAEADPVAATIIVIPALED